ncbi:MAG: carbamoyltransferase HypF [Armatimonadetes bacterium]|nr:carbamoyltransferase HypF [Armatimonadota bacterium]
MDTREQTRGRKIRVTGVVQGVGFRPFVYRLAGRHGLAGWVRNTSGSVEIEVEGPTTALDAFVLGLQADAPELARIDSVVSINADPAGYEGFQIIESKADVTCPDSVVPADIGACGDCLREIDDPQDRRRAYPFTNCTNCGPRFTIIRRVPYDRPSTTMAAFKMCPECASEYRDPINRRFHAEPTACPVCGPRVWLELDGSVVEHNSVEAVGWLLTSGKVVAIKGLGGFHLACDAMNDEAVRTLRERKGRVSKPFALMVRDMEEAERLCEIDDAARDLLLSPKRPIVLAKQRATTGVSEHVAPGNQYLGLMLPYTPLHALLFRHSPSALVMTSGNLSEEPLAFTNTCARRKLAGMADAFLMHDRNIHVPCDDSVVRPIGSGAMIMRRARGFVPDAIDLPIECECVLGVGAEQRNTFCLGWGRKAVPSQHIGNLDTAETFDYYQYAIEHFLALFRREPGIVAHDLHPDYLSTRYAKDRPGARLIAVQHHHAHIAACLAENGRAERCIGVALDGTGFGTDGTVWGGEVLLADLAGFDRIGRFAQVRMPGGEAAVRNPRRMAAAYLHEAYGQDWERAAGSLSLNLSPLEFQATRHQLETGLNSPMTSSAGRLFDAVSAAIGACRERSYEGQPAIELEMSAEERETGLYPTQVQFDADMIILDTMSLFRAAMDDRMSGTGIPTISARFHNSLVEMLGNACEQAREMTGLNLVALSGGVFQNALILIRLREKLIRLGFEVIIHKLLPPNDACISYGQVAVAAAKLKQKEECYVPCNTNEGR